MLTIHREHWRKITLTIAPPLPNLWSSAHADVYPNSFYPVTGLTVKRTAVSRTAYYPVTFDTSPWFSMHVHHACLQRAQSIWVLFYSNPLGAHFSTQNLANLSSYSLHISTLSLILKGFNIGHKHCHTQEWSALVSIATLKNVENREHW